MENSTKAQRRVIRMSGDAGRLFTRYSKNEAISLQFGSTISVTQGASPGTKL